LLCLFFPSYPVFSNHGELLLHLPCLHVHKSMASLYVVAQNSERSQGFLLRTVVCYHFVFLCSSLAFQANMAPTKSRFLQEIYASPGLCYAQPVGVMLAAGISNVHCKGNFCCDLHIW
jgi:hypothetical protein